MEEGKENKNWQPLIENFFEKFFKDKEKPYSKDEIRKWLNDNSEKAVNISFATHVPKLTHSIINASSFNDKTTHQKDRYLSTSTLKNRAVDGAVKGNQYAPVFKFLNEVELNGKKILSEFSNISTTVLKVFAQNDQELQKWNKNFNMALVDKQISTHLLTKQIYFPTNDKESKSTLSYHLLSNVKSSSMTQAIFEKIKPKKYEDKDKYLKDTLCWFPKKAKIQVTASNHSNASQLNGKRGGKIILLSTQPPIWKSQIKPPLGRSMFYRYLPIKNDNFKYLSDFLVRFKSLNLSINDPRRKVHVERWIDNIIDDWLFYVGSIHKIKSGWSEDSKLKEAHQFLLDPYREGEGFQEQLKSGNWQIEVCFDFADWFNRRLKKANKKFTPQKEYTKIWRRFLERSLREYFEVIL